MEIELTLPFTCFSRRTWWTLLITDSFGKTQKLILKSFNWIKKTSQTTHSPPRGKKKTNKPKKQTCWCQEENCVCACLWRVLHKCTVTGFPSPSLMPVAASSTAGAAHLRDVCYPLLCTRSSDPGHLAGAAVRWQTLPDEPAAKSNSASHL